MASLAALKAKLGKKKSLRVDKEVSVNNDDDISKISDSATFVFSDYVAWENRLTEEGHDPEVWLQYIDHLQEKSFTDDYSKYNQLCSAYVRAFKVIPPDDNKKNGFYARLLLRYADLKSEYNPDEAETVLDRARHFVRRFAVVHVAYAEFEVKQGNDWKARKVLKKADLYNAEPVELIEIACKNLDEGRCKLVNDEEREYGLRIVISESSQDNDTVDNVQQNDEIDSKTEECYTAPITVGREDSILSSSCKSSIRHFKRTPECRSKSFSTNPFSANKWKRPAKVSVGPPMRVKLNLPSSDTIGLEDLTEDSTMNSFKPLDSFHKNNNETFGAHSSGYASSTTRDLTDITNSQNISDNDNKFDTEKLGPASSHSTQDSVNKANLLSDGDTQNKRQCTAHHVPCFKLPATELALNQPCSMKVSPQKISDIKTEFCNNELKTSKTDIQIDINECDNQNVVPDKNIPIPTSVETEKSIIYEVSLKKMSDVENKVIPEPKMNVPIPMPVKMGCDVKIINGVSYSILKLAGRGGSAKVYQVLDEENNVRALKCVDLEGSSDIIIEGYKNEINLLKRLQYCDAVIKIYDYDFDEVNNKLNVILEYGETDLAVNLLSRKKGGKLLGEATIRFYWQEMLCAVNALHKEGIIHSDLKPANFIFVAANLKLIDFGIADAVQQDKTSVFRDITVGTVSYMSPEAIKESCEGQGKYKISVRSDVWSLGCILYNMVYGKTPFQHIRNQIMKVHAIKNDQHVIEFPDIPDKNLLDVLKKCLLRDAKQRPTTEDLLHHQYLTPKQTEESPVPTKPKEKRLQNILDQISEFSPRSMQAFQGMVVKMGSERIENIEEQSNSVECPLSSRSSKHQTTNKAGRPPLQCIYKAS